jgi:hypothetical protein
LIDPVFGQWVDMEKKRAEQVRRTGPLRSVKRNHEHLRQEGKAAFDIGTTALDDVRKLRRAHQNDPNLPEDEIEALDEAARSGDAEKAAELDEAFTKESPYEAVQAAVRETDGEEVANTLRAWILGFIFVTVAAGVNMFLSMRSPAITIPTVVIMLLVYPLGCLWARIMPTKKFTSFGVTWSLNTGPFTIKEHAVITLMANVTYGYAYSTDALLALKAKPLYNLDMGWGFQMLFTLSSQIIGIGLAGVFRRFVVWPAAIIWPANFSMTTLLHALHDKSKTDPAMANGWRISRYRWFVYVAVGSFAYCKSCHRFLCFAIDLDVWSFNAMTRQQASPGRLLKKLACWSVRGLRICLVLGDGRFTVTEQARLETVIPGQSLRREIISSRPAYYPKYLDSLVEDACFQPSVSTCCTLVSVRLYPVTIVLIMRS